MHIGTIDRKSEAKEVLQQLWRSSKSKFDEIAVTVVSKTGERGEATTRKILE